MRILAIDLAKRTSVACLYNTETAEAAYRSLPTGPQAFHDLLAEIEPARLVIEIGPASGWIRDLCEAMAIRLQAAETHGPAWSWRRVKRKSDRADALKLAQLSAMGQITEVHVPVKHVRQWRMLIGYRRTLVKRRTALKNRIRAILETEAMDLPSGAAGFTGERLEQLREWAKPMEEAGADELWRGILHEELTQFEHVRERIRSVEARLDALGRAEQRVQQLQSIPGVGARLSEAVVAVLDEPHRFRRARQVAGYVGLTPRQFQSGSMDRKGRITGAGHRTLRALLVEAAWIALRYNPAARAVYEQVRRGSPARKKVAIVAVARRLLCWCWAMLRDGTPWRPPVTTSG